MIKLPNANLKIKLQSTGYRLNNTGVIPDLMCWCGKMVEIIDVLVFSSGGRIRG
jgi:hypothetical protein